MSDRKYRQHGYQDDDRGPRPPRAPGGEGARPEREPGAPAGARRISSEGAKNPRMMGYHAVVRCARCASPVDSEVMSLSSCAKCQLQLHSCIQCVNFDPSARFECTQPLTFRVAPKDAANECSLYSPRGSWERETTAATSQKPSEPSGARKAFDDLFKF